MLTEEGVSLISAISFIFCFGNFKRSVGAIHSGSKNFLGYIGYNMK